MTFRSKIDGSFKVLIITILLIMFAGLILPLVLTEGVTTTDIIIIVLVVTASTCFFLSIILSLKYIFHDTYLLVQGGLIRSRIPYESITAVTPFNQLLEALTGYTLLSSKEGLEISYSSGILGSVRISPEDRELFISELEKRCPQIKIKSNI